MSHSGVRTDLYDEKSAGWKIWVLVFILVCFFHSLLFMVQITKFPFDSPPLEVQSLDTKKLQEIKQQWKKLPLLVDKNPSIPSEKIAPPHARYMSDRNQTIEKEQRARENLTGPKIGSPQNPTQTQWKKNSRTTSNLGNLGIPFQLTSSPIRSPSQEGREQSLLENSLPEGSENLLNTQESVFYSFYARMRGTIAPIWYSLIQDASRQSQLGRGDYTTTIDAILDEKGNLIEIHRLQSCGIAALDQVAEDSWKKAAGFPNPPQALLDSEKHVHIIFSFRINLTSGPQIRYNSP